MRLKHNEYWAGFVNGEIHFSIGNAYARPMGELFKSRKTALRGYEDVRKIRIVEVKRAKGSGNE